MSTATRARWSFRLRLLADIGRRLRIRSCALAILLALTLQPATPARAECSWDDALSAVQQAAKATGVCYGVCGTGDQYSCYAAAGLAIILVELSRSEEQGQGKVDSFCNFVQNSLNTIADKVELIKQIMDLLQTMGANTANYSESLSEAAKDVANVLSIVNCACETEDLQVKNEASFGACFNDALEAVGCGKIDFTTSTIPDCDPIGGFVVDVVNEARNEVHKACCKLELPLCNCDEGHAPGWWNVYCNPGYQSDDSGNCLPCEKTNIEHAITLGNGRCGCESLYSPKYRVGCIDADCTNTQNILLECTCKPPMEVDKDGHCLCPWGQQEAGGLCVACGWDRKYTPYHVDAKGNAFLPSCTSQCQIGWEQSKDDPTQCVSGFASCDPKAGEVLDPNTYGKTCQRCSDTQRVAGGGSVYGDFCENCDQGQKASADHSQCIPACQSGQIITVLTESCVTCQKNDFAVYDNLNSSVGRCEPCPDYTRSTPGSTTCTPVLCGIGGYVDPDNKHSCKFCPPGQIFIEAKLVPMPGATEIDKKVAKIAGHCGSPSAESVPHAMPKDCSTLGPTYINDPKNAAQCIRCTGGQMANEARTACIAKVVKPGTFQRTAPPVTHERKLKRALQCPPRTTPNAAGTACIHRPDLRRVTPPALLQPRRVAPGIRRTAPGTSPRVGVPATRR